jgi:hypothetical protein
MHIDLNRPSGLAAPSNLSRVTQSITRLGCGAREPKGLALSLLSWSMYLVLVTFYLVDGLLQQIEMLLTGGSTPINGSIKIVVLFIALASVLIARHFRRSQISYATIMLSAFICVDFGILYLTTNFHALDILYSFKGNLVPLFLCGAILSAPLNLKQRGVLAGGTAVFIACIVISTLQYITDTSVLPTQSRDGTFLVQSFLFYGHARAFSLFSNGYQAGLFYCIPAALGAILLLRRRILLGGLLVSLSIFGSYATLTRLTLLNLVACLCSAVMLCSPRLSRITKMLPVIWALVPILAISAASQVPQGSRRADISSTASLGDRLHGWRQYGDKYMSGSLTAMLFGNGMSEYEEIDVPNRRPTAAPDPIDNGYLQLLLHSGVISLGVVTYFYIQAWRMLYAKACHEQTLFSLSGAAVFSTSPFLAAINDLPVAMFALFAIAMMIRAEGHIDTPCVVRRSGLGQGGIVLVG